MSEYNLTLLQLEILLAVESNEGDTLSDIISRGFLPTNSPIATISSPLQRLAEGTSRTGGRGFVKRVVSSHNANASLLFLTDDGKKVLKEIKNKINYK
ncbi:hypothetical protein [Zooshikella sp. RANM57]|uniref:hypothetical protein n=1 Tax=Zooshikella sp. RANM57 TaxID=3425863 RepID=UPI003D6ECB93